MAPIITPVLTVGVGLAQIVIDFMRMRQDNRLAGQNHIAETQRLQMEHEFQFQLQLARQEHEKMLESIRSRNPDPRITAIVEADSNFTVPRVYVEEVTHLPEFLNEEAALICSKSFNVVIDPVHKGYAMAVFVRTDFTIAFWLHEYPDNPPVVFAITPFMLEQIQFEANAWDSTRKLIEVVDALAYCY